VLIGAAVAWKPSRVTLQTLVVVPSLVGAQPQPLQLFGAAPRRESLAYPVGPGSRGRSG